ncbi:unnamed protein product [Ambrosiozyma monospora]|uniref:Unnamed protein product n=1 Tax=Ambrosiozyma monospora TaxID=43982 RepID=A0ACB5UCG9_AMBMO|nr:unnamed protein product [Ambrosiozyma monospora]
MSNTTYNTNPKESSSSTKYTCNVLPVNIDFTGTLSTTTKFWNAQLAKDEEKNQSVNYLRGRRLVGTHHENFGGSDADTSTHTLKVYRKGETDFQKDTNTYEVVGECPTLVNYGHEKVPGSDDCLERLNEWFELSRCIHDDD